MRINSSSKLQLRYGDECFKDYCSYVTYLAKKIMDKIF